MLSLLSICSAISIILYTIFIFLLSYIYLIPICRLVQNFTNFLESISWTFLCLPVLILKLENLVINLGNQYMFVIKISTRYQFCIKSSTYIHLFLRKCKVLTLDIEPTWVIVGSLGIWSDSFTLSKKTLQLHKCLFCDVKKLIIIFQFL